MTEMMVFSGSASRNLAQRVAELLGIKLGDIDLGRFSDGEIAVEVKENVRGRTVFIIQSTCPPTNDSLMELLVMADALRRSSARKIIAVMPYFGYARQDRRIRSARVPITARLVADMISTSGINRVLTVDLHAEQIQGFFTICVDNVYGTPVLMDDILAKDISNITVVSPDVGGVVRARAFAKRLNDAELAIIDKRRPKANDTQVMHIIGEVEGRSCIIVDDIVDTAGTLCSAAKALKDKGAKQVLAYCTHPVLSGNALENISGSVIDEVVVTDTIPLSIAAQQCKKVRQVSLDKMMAEAMRRVHKDKSLRRMFD